MGQGWKRSLDRGITAGNRTTRRQSTGETTYVPVTVGAWVERVPPTCRYGTNFLKYYCYYVDAGRFWKLETSVYGYYIILTVRFLVLQGGVQCWILPRSQKCIKYSVCSFFSGLSNVARESSPRLFSA